MKKMLIALTLAVTAFTLPMADAEAKRLGGGKSVGMQRDMSAAKPASPPPAQQAAPVPHANPAPAAAPAAQPKRSWMGPLAGLAAGLGIGALLGGSGMFGGGGMGGIMEMLMLAALVFFGFKMFQMFRAQKSAAPAADPMQYAGVGGPGMAPIQNEPIDVTPAPVGTSAPAPVQIATAPALPADFDKEAFLRVAKVNFIRMQAAFDAGNVEDLREFTAPELFAEIKMDLNERAGKSQQTDVVTLDAELLDLQVQGTQNIVSVRFHGLIREEAGGAAEPVDEIWHLSKPADGSRGWVVAGIQQS